MTYLLLYKSKHIARKNSSNNVPRGAGTSDKKCVPGVGTMQNRAEGRYTIPAPLPGIQLTGTLVVAIVQYDYSE